MLKFIKPRYLEILKFGINGLFATLVHFAVLTFNLKVLGIPSAGVANFIAAVFGISTSFLGNRYFVFRKNDVSFLVQASKFVVLYAVLAAFQGLFLFCWTDLLKMDYRLGFVIATFFQVVLSYFGNRSIVFKHENT